MNALKIILTIFSVCSFGNALVAQKPKSNSATKGEVETKLVRVLLTKHQINKQKIDARFCGRWFGKYIESLDPMHLYFLDSDISEFKALSVRLPESAKTGNLEFCNLVTSRYKSRAERSLAYAEQRIGQSFDFSIDEHKPLFHLDWAIGIEDRNERWRLQLKHDLLLESSAEFNRAAAIEFIKIRYTSIRQQAQEMSNERAIQLFLDSFCHAADPHCSYLTQSELDSFRGSFVNSGWRTGLIFEFRRSRLMVREFLPEFQAKTTQPSPLGCELLAIRTNSGIVYNFREIDPNTIFFLLRNGLGKDSSFTLELYDEVLQRRFSANWLRKAPSR